MCILVEFDAAIKNANDNNEEISSLGDKMTSFGIIGARIIVTSQSKNAWDYVLDKFRGKLSKKEFTAMADKAKTEPPWWKDTGATLLEETNIQ